MRPRPKEKSRLRILVLDDDSNVLDLTKVMLKYHGYSRVELTSDPVNAMRKLERKLIDIAFLDWNLPNLSGLELVRALRGQMNDVPIIMLTGESDRDKVMQALSAGASDYIVKPFFRTTLISKLEEVLAKTDPTTPQE